jgi:hypothetical protein
MVLFLGEYGGGSSLGCEGFLWRGWGLCGVRGMPAVVYRVLRLG